MAKTNIDVTSVLARVLSSRAQVHDLRLFLRNTGATDVVLDFAHVSFATRSFMDEFYNVFLAKEDASLHVEIQNLSPDFRAMLSAVKRTQRKSVKTASSSSTKSFDSVDAFCKYVRSL